MKNQFQQFFSPNLAEARPDGIYSLRSSKKKRGDDSLVVQGCFGVVAQLFDVDTKELSYLVRTRAMHAQRASTTIVPCQHISNKRWLIDHLCKHGLLIIDPKEFYMLFQNSVQLSIQNARSKESMTRTGWDRKMSSFSTGAKLIAVDHARLEGLHLIANPSSTMQHSGRFESWLKHVFNPCAQNPILLGVLGMALSTTTMRSTKVGNRWLHLFGLHGKGKTTALQCAASLFGNAVDPGQANPSMEHAPYLTKMNATNAGMEATLNGHYDRPMIADELGEASRLGIGKIAYMLHSGEGMSTGTSDRKLAEKLRWSTHLLSAGEVSLEEKMREEGPTMGGQLDRAVDIRTDGRMPIFFDIAPFDNM